MGIGLLIIHPDDAFIRFDWFYVLILIVITEYRLWIKFLPEKEGHLLYRFFKMDGKRNQPRNRKGSSVCIPKQRPWSGIIYTS